MEQKDTELGKLISELEASKDAPPAQVSCLPLVIARCPGSNARMQRLPHALAPRLPRSRGLATVSTGNRKMTCQA